MSRIDMGARKVERTVSFPEGAKPYMLRVTPDGKHLWVQTAGTHQNVILDVETMEQVAAEETGKGPVQSAFGPAGGRYGLVMDYRESFVIVIDRRTFHEVKRIDVGGGQANASFTRDGRYALVTVTATNEVVSIDMTGLEIVGRLPTGADPMGLVILPENATNP